MDNRKIKHVLTAMAVHGIIPFGAGMFMLGRAGDSATALGMAGICLASYGLAMWTVLCDILSDGED